jgi:hypothetical protein
MFGLFLSLGSLFGGLAAAAAYLIAYHEYRQRFLRPDQNAARMALQTGVVTFVFFVAGSVVLYFALRPEGQ